MTAPAGSLFYNSRPDPESRRRWWTAACEEWLIVDRIHYWLSGNGRLILGTAGDVERRACERDLRVHGWTLDHVLACRASALSSSRVSSERPPETCETWLRTWIEPEKSMRATAPLPPRPSRLWPEAQPTSPERASAWNAAVLDLLAKRPVTPPDPLPGAPEAEALPTLARGEVLFDGDDTGGERNSGGWD